MQADGLANVLAIGTANPANCVLQEDYPDWFFRVTDSDHLTHLKTKMKKICKIILVVLTTYDYFRSNVLICYG